MRLPLPRNRDDFPIVWSIPEVSESDNQLHRNMLVVHHRQCLPFRFESGNDLVAWRIGDKPFPGDFELLVAYGTRSQTRRKVQDDRHRTGFNLLLPRLLREPQRATRQTDGEGIGDQNLLLIDQFLPPQYPQRVDGTFVSNGNFGSGQNLNRELLTADHCFTKTGDDDSIAFGRFLETIVRSVKRSSATK